MRTRETPLHAAARADRADAVEALLARGADVTLRDAQGRLAASLVKPGTFKETNRTSERAREADCSGATGFALVCARESRMQRLSGLR